MKLYFSPGACSLSPHILLQETGQASETIKVDLRSKQFGNGESFLAVNPKGSVPTLEISPGVILTEGPVIAQYICDQAGRKDLMPQAGTIERYRVMEWQNYTSTELHKSYSPLFNPAADPATKQLFAQALRTKYTWVSTQLEGRNFLTGETFTAADAYLFVVTNWAKLVGLDLSDLSALQAFMGRVASRPAVQAALKAEGLLG
jgi:glutathione S-transferase